MWNFFFGVEKERRSVSEIYLKTLESERFGQVRNDAHRVPVPSISHATTWLVSLVYTSHLLTLQESVLLIFFHKLNDNFAALLGSFHRLVQILKVIYPFHYL